MGGGLEVFHLIKQSFSGMNEIVGYCLYEIGENQINFENFCTNQGQRLIIQHQFGS